MARLCSVCRKELDEDASGFSFFCSDECIKADTRNAHLMAARGRARRENAIRQQALREVRDEWSRILVRWAGLRGANDLANAVMEFSDTFREGGAFEVRESDDRG